MFTIICIYIGSRWNVIRVPKTTFLKAQIQTETCLMIKINFDILHGLNEP